MLATSKIDSMARPNPAAVAPTSATGDLQADPDLADPAAVSSLPSPSPSQLDLASRVVKPAHRAFSPATTGFIVATVASVAFLGPLGANVGPWASACQAVDDVLILPPAVQIYIPALPVLALAFDENIKTINLTLSTSSRFDSRLPLLTSRPSIHQRSTSWRRA